MIFSVVGIVFMPPTCFNVCVEFFPSAFFFNVSCNPAVPQNMSQFLLSENDFLKF